MKGHAELPHRFQKSRSVCHLGIRLLFSLSNVVIESTLVRIPYFFSQRKKKKKKRDRIDAAHSYSGSQTGLRPVLLLERCQATRSNDTIGNISSIIPLGNILNLGRKSRSQEDAAPTN